MSELSPWHYSGTFPRTESISILESVLEIAGIEAAERGYPTEPETINIAEVMLSSDGGMFITAGEAYNCGIGFMATHVKFTLTWKFLPEISPCQIDDAQTT